MVDHLVDAVLATDPALACIAALAGGSAGDAVAYVRQHYHHRAVETLFQKRFVRSFAS